MGPLPNVTDHQISKEKSKEEGIGAANRRPQTLHRGCRHPQRTLATLVEGSGSPIGGLDPESTEDPESNSDPSTEGTSILCGCRRPRWRV
ncbi:hypothetical protein CRG98_022704 [Punica granatum]|uniref:Uncharacterized protein n=1 Tax=Punica granatum TaxID=22663 RepID=A0A2I0JKQ5_PUNGR|nr:hypothetical protein CRG98_022704 [Punica granatum]